MESKLLEEKVQIKSIANWVTATPRILGSGDITLQPNGATMISRDEVINQSQRGNKLINGTDGKGSHATWIILDDLTREELMFENYEIVTEEIPPKEGSKAKPKTVETKNKISSQLIVEKKKVEEIFKLTNIEQFKKAVVDLVVTRAEKLAFMNFVKIIKTNDYTRISFCENHCGVRLF